MSASRRDRARGRAADSGRGGVPGSAILFMAVLVVVAGYLHTLAYPFQYDDFDSIRDNPALNGPLQWSHVWGFRPSRFLAYASFAINATLTGLSPVGFRAVNLMIHLAVALLVGAIARQLAEAFRPPASPDRRVVANRIGLLATLFFAAHPLATQAVTYVVQRTTSMGALFELSAVALYMRARSGTGTASWLFSWTCALLAGLTKEMAVVLPALIVLLEWRLRKSPSASSVRTPLIMLLPYLLVVPLVAVTTQLPSLQDWRTPDVQREPLHYALTQLTVVPRYVALALWPHGQSLDPEVHARRVVDLAVVAGFVLVVALMAVAVVIRRRRPLAALGMAWFFLALVPESSVFPISDLMVEHRAYVPLVGFAWTMAELLTAWPVKSSARVALAAALVVTWTTVTHVRNRVWRDGVALWGDAARKAPDRPRPLNNYGSSLRETGRLNEAERAFRRAIAIDSTYAEARISLASLYRAERRLDEAIQTLEHAIASSPGDWRFHNNLGVTWSTAGDTGSAARAYQRAMALAPGRPEPALNLARMRRRAAQR